MELVQQFLAHPQSEIIMLFGGGLLAIFCFVQIIRKGFALVLYLILFTIGMFPVMYAFKGSDVDFLASAQAKVTEISSLAPGIKDDVLKIWCDKLDEAGQ